MIHGRDYASVDGNIVDPAAAHADGTRFALVRGAYTFRGQALADSCLARDRDRWRDAGVTFGAYMILGWNLTPPEEQVRRFAATYGPRRSDELPPSLDLEADSAASLHETPKQAHDWALRAYDALRAIYGQVMIYTSSRVWSEVLGGAPSRMGASPLWIKVPYPWLARRPPHPESCPPVHDLPLPWRDSASPGAWIEQYQGDAVGAAGFSTTVDLNAWLSFSLGKGDAREPWITAQLAKAGAPDVQSLQRSHELGADGIIGPATFARLA